MKFAANDTFTVCGSEKVLLVKFTVPLLVRFAIAATGEKMSCAVYQSDTTAGATERDSCSGNDEPMATVPFGTPVSSTVALASVAAESVRHANNSTSIIDERMDSMT